MKNLSLKMLILGTIIGATQTMHCTPSFFVRVKKVIDGKTVQLVDFVADVHQEVAASAAIECDLFTHLDKLDNQAITNKISLYWEFLLGHIKRPLYSFKEYLKNPRGQFKEVVQSLDYGPWLNNDLLKRIQVKNIDLRSYTMYSISQWASGMAFLKNPELPKDLHIRIDQYEDIKLFAQKIHKDRGIGDGTIPGIIAGLTFSDVIEELAIHLKRFDAMQLDEIAQSELDWLRAFKSKCDLVYAGAKDKSFELCAVAFDAHTKPLVETIYNKDAARYISTRTFGRALIDCYIDPVVDIELYNAIKNDSNHHVIAFAGAMHTHRVMNMFLQSGYELVAAYKVSGAPSVPKMINDEWDKWYDALPPLESFDIVLQEELV